MVDEVGKKGVYLCVNSGKSVTKTPRPEVLNDHYSKDTR